MAGLVRHAPVPAVADVGVLAVTDDSWNGYWTTRHFMLRHLARLFRVAWLEPMKDWRSMIQPHRSGDRSSGTGIDGVAKCQPLGWLPDVYRPRWLRSAIRASRYASAAAWLRMHGCRRVVLHVWRPSHADALDSRRWFDAVIYHIDDEYSFSDTACPMSAAERRLIEEADAVIVHSPGLAHRKGGINKNTYIVPNGVDYEHYARPCLIPPDLRAIPTPRIGYVGIIKKQLDLSLVRQLAERRPDWSFVLVGPLGNVCGEENRIEALSRLPNVHLLGYRDPEQLPSYQKHVDVCIMPYKVNAYTDCIYPLKLHEYLAAGKPIVASPVRTLRDFSHVVSLASGVEEWVAAIESGLSGEALAVERVAERRAISREHDWSALAGRTAAIMASFLGGNLHERVLAAIPKEPGPVHRSDGQTESIDLKGGRG